MIAGKGNKHLKILLFFVVLLSCQGTTMCFNSGASKIGAKCLATSDCNPPYVVCQSNKCVRKPLFPMTNEEIGAIFVLVTLCIVAMCCSLSGGLVIVPITILMIDFDAKQAVTLANSIVLLTSFIKYLNGLPKKSTDLNFKTIVDYNAAITMIPTITLASTFGGMLVTFIPDILGLLLLVILLMFSMITASLQIRRLLKCRKIENAVRASEAEPQAAVCSERNIPPVIPVSHKIQIIEHTSTDVPLVAPVDGALITAHKEDKCPSDQDNVVATHGTILETENVNIKEEEQQNNEREIMEQKRIDGSNFYYKKFLLIVIVLIFVVIMTLFRGGKQVKSIIGIDTCSDADWSILGAYVAVLLSLSYYSYCVVQQEQDIRMRIGYEKIAPKQVVITKKIFLITALWSSFTGLVTTITGLGGGVLLTPFFIWMNYTPITSSYTINLMVMLSKVAAIVVAVLAGQFLTSYVFFYGGIISVAMIIAENSLLIIIKKMKSQIMIPSGFVAVLAIAMIMNLYIGIQEWIDKNKAGVSAWTFASYC